MKTITRFFETQEAAVKDAKSRATSRYRTQYIYRSEQGFYMREMIEQDHAPIVKVLYGGTVQAYGE